MRHAVYSFNTHRQAVYNKWAELDIPGHHGRILASMLGMDVFISYMTDEQNKLCKLLAGPNGYAIYRVLLLRMQDEI